MKKTYLILLILLFALLPFNALLTNIVNFKLGISLPINAWKEGIVVILTCIVAGNYLYHRQWPQLTWLDYIIASFFLLGILSAIFQTQELGRILYGLKYDFEFLWLFLLVRHGPSLTSKDIQTVFTVALSSGAVVVIFGLLQLTILPKDIMTLFGYAPAIGTWVPGGPLPMYHTIDTDGYIVRIASSLSGPNQYASYLLLLIPLLVWKTWKTETKKIWWGCVSILAITNLIVTYSRSAYIALIGSILLTGVLIIKNKQTVKKVILIVLITCISIGAIATVIKPDIWHSLIIRASSTQGHFERTQDGIMYSLQNPLGHGIGNAGPASTRFNEDQIGWIPESWYLQISLELGILGLLLFLIIIIGTWETLHERWNIKNTWSVPLSATLFAISLSSLFLHSWEEAAVALSCWGLMGLVLHRGIEKNTSSLYNT